MLLGFRDKMPAEHSVLLARLIDLGARCINYSARLGFYTYMNLLLLQRGSLLGMILSTVPSDQMFFLGTLGFLQTRPCYLWTWLELPWRRDVLLRRILFSNKPYC